MKSEEEYLFVCLLAIFIIFSMNCLNPLPIFKLCYSILFELYEYLYSSIYRHRVHKCRLLFSRWAFVLSHGCFHCVHFLSWRWSHLLVFASLSSFLAPVTIFKCHLKVIESIFG